MITNSARLLLRAISLLFAFILTAAPTKPSVNGRTTQTAAPLTKFDASVRRLPAHFSGGSIETAFRTFRVPPKGEFETSAEYATRAKRLPWGVYAFVVPKRYSTLTYDADAGSLIASLNVVSPAVGFDRIDSAAIELSRTNERRRTYLASNAFGGSVTVDEYAYSSYSIITSLSELPELVLPVPRSRAARVKDNLRVLAVVSLDENSYIAPSMEVLRESTGFRHIEPTFDDPSEVTIFDYSLRGELLQLWVFDRSTGDVLARFNPDGTEVETNAPQSSQ